MPSPSVPSAVRSAVSELASSEIVAVWQRGFDIKNLIGLYVGEGDVPTPDFICQAADAALKRGETFYTYKRGLPALRQALADYHARLWGLKLSPKRISVTSGGMGAVQVALQATCGPGDKLALVTPAWPNVFSAARVHGVEVASVPLTPKPEGGFTLDLEKLFAAAEGAKAIFLISPGNPTGWMIEPEEQRSILDFCRKNGLWLIADEVYHRFVYDRPVAPSFLEQAEGEDALIVINSFSKSWAMTGWRLGWMVHPESFEKAADDLIEYNTSGAPPFVQQAALAALSDQGEVFVKEQVARCGQAGEMVFQRLASLSRISIARPTASFYSFFRVEGMDSPLPAALEILEKTGVGLAPGTAFGPGGEGHLRLCFATRPPRIAEALERLADYWG